MDQDRTPPTGQPDEGAGTPEGTGAPEETGATVCSRCGRVAEGTPVTWTCSVEDGVRRYLCEGCARDNIRSIEGRLDSSWW